MRVWAEPFRPIYDPSVGEDEPWYVNDHTIFRDRTGTWHLIGITHAEPLAPFDEQHLAHATAPALTGPWTKQAFALTADPSWGETQLWAPHVIEHDDRLWMYVCGGGADHAAYRIQLAVSSDDGWTWTRHPANPMVVDGYEARDPMVLRVGDRWVMYYTATDPAARGAHVVAAAGSDDLVRWSGRTIVLRDELEGTGAGPCESPFVVERDGRWFLFVGPDYAGQLRELEAVTISSMADVAAVLRDSAAYRTTRVLVSDDPMHFDADAVVGTIDAHAPEVVVDEAGDLWITHCGWGQGGVHLARLHVEAGDFSYTT